VETEKYFPGAWVGAGVGGGVGGGALSSVISVGQVGLQSIVTVYDPSPALKPLL